LDHGSKLGGEEQGFGRREEQGLGKRGGTDWWRRRGGGLWGKKRSGDRGGEDAMGWIDWGSGWDIFHQ
jgi:hypothetical protein